MKHIVFVIGNYKNGGVARRSTNIANELAEKGYIVTLLATGKISEEVFFKLEKNVEVVSLSDYITANSNNKSLIKNRNKRIRIIKLYKLLQIMFSSSSKIKNKLNGKVREIRRSEEIDDYLSFNQAYCFIPFGIGLYEKVFYAANKRGIKVIYAEKNAPELELPSDEAVRKEIISHLKKANTLVLQTEDEAGFYKKHGVENTFVIHNPIKANLPLPFEGGRKHIVTNFCRISEQKNLPLLFDAFERLHNDYPDYILEIYGNTVEEREERLRDSLIESLNKTGRNEYIKILPPCADVHERIRDYAMFVSSSDFEGLSNSMIEAMAIGMPCVCTDCLGGGAREMIEDGENGLLVPMNDAEALYKAMKRFADDKELSDICSENAARIKDEMSAEKIAERWIEVIERV